MRNSRTLKEKTEARLHLVLMQEIASLQCVANLEGKTDEQSLATKKYFLGLVDRYKNEAKKLLGFLEDPNYRKGVCSDGRTSHDDGNVICISITNKRNRLPDNASEFINQVLSNGDLIILACKNAPFDLPAVSLDFVSEVTLPVTLSVDGQCITVSFEK